MSSFPPDDGSWDIYGSTTIEWYQKTFDGDVLRPDLAVVITEFELGGPAGPPHQNSQGFELFSMIIPSADISCTIVVIS